LIDYQLCVPHIIDFYIWKIPAVYCRNCKAVDQKPFWRWCSNL